MKKLRNIDAVFVFNGRKKTKRKKFLKRTRKKIPNLMECVRDFIIELRDANDKEFEKITGYTQRVVTKEEVAIYFGVTQGEIETCFQALNREGILSQPSHRAPHDSKREIWGYGDDNSWAADRYYILNYYSEPKNEAICKEPPELNHDNCPICEKPLSIDEDHVSYGIKYKTLLCKNKCYKHRIVRGTSIYTSRDIVLIFDKTFLIEVSDHKSFKNSIKKDIEKEINYWTKNYRYIMKILED